MFLLCGYCHILFLIIYTCQKFKKNVLYHEFKKTSLMKATLCWDSAVWINFIVFGLDKISGTVALAFWDSHHIAQWLKHEEGRYCQMCHNLWCNLQLTSFQWNNIEHMWLAESYCKSECFQNWKGKWKGRENLIN